MLVEGERDFQLGADAVGAADQDRVLVVERPKVEHAAESPDIAHAACDIRRGHVFFYAAHHLTAWPQDSRPTLHNFLPFPLSFFIIVVL